jgi:heme-degrading monooxygenase HmoA
MNEDRSLGLIGRALMACALAMLATVAQPTHAQAVPDLVGPVTVVVEVTIAPNATPADALAALSDMRALMKRQAGYVSEEFLQNLNADNTPQYVHVSRWATMTYWAALFRTPEFSKINAHANSHYSIAVMALLPVEQMAPPRN